MLTELLDYPAEPECPLNSATFLGCRCVEMYCYCYCDASAPQALSATVLNVTVERKSTVKR